MPINLSKPRAPKRGAVARPGPQSPAPEELLTIRDAMAFAKVSDATIRRWIRRKELPAHKAGGQVRIDKADLVKFLQPWSPRKPCEYHK